MTVPEDNALLEKLRGWADMAQTFGVEDGGLHAQAADRIKALLGALEAVANLPEKWRSESRFKPSELSEIKLVQGEVRWLVADELEKALTPGPRSKQMDDQPIVDDINTDVASRLLGSRGDSPVATCPSDREPLVPTFERRGAEFVCAVCGSWYGFLSPTPADSTPELEARAQELAEAWRAGTAPAQRAEP